MKIHRLLLTCLVVAGWFTPEARLLAQTNTAAATNSLPPPPRAPASMADIQTRRLSVLLKLTEDQKPKVKAAWEQEQAKMESMPPAERQGQRAVFQAEFDAKLKKILTPEQYEQWEQLRNHRFPRQRAPSNPQTPSSVPATNHSDAPH